MKTKCTIALLLLLLQSNPVQCLDTDSTLLKLLTYRAHINYFNRLCPQEKVYLHFDNTAYFQGETIRFSATLVNAVLCKPLHKKTSVKFSFM